MKNIFNIRKICVFSYNYIPENSEELTYSFQFFFRKPRFPREEGMCRKPRFPHEEGMCRKHRFPHEEGMCRKPRFPHEEGMCIFLH